MISFTIFTSGAVSGLLVFELLNLVVALLKDIAEHRNAPQYIPGLFDFMVMHVRNPIFLEAATDGISKLTRDCGRLARHASS